ncbi:MAG TPA: T9SS type A sorting domain-containing protein [Ignavibacteriaceae bacterium]|nr:T9SS type A sorting domain-containing protein [Ignavibacteriaceae bacterium]
MKKRFLSIVFILICTIELFPQKVGDAYALNINNIYMPLNRKGVLADVNVPPNGSEGQFGGHSFLFSGGFFLSGYSNGVLWANAVASASLVEDYIPGNVDGEWNPNAVLYRVGSADPPFGQSWLDWIDAVSLGADFYDGDADGIYNPVDKNGNSIWDLDEDCPDILGDETLWCVYHDGLPVVQRRWNTTIEVGIEVRQTVFAYSSVSELQNIIFIRYRIKYVGLGLPTEPDILDDVYFSVWDDPDLGSSSDDLVGCDTLLTGEFTYNDGPDNEYGNNPPCFFVKTLNGPVTYVPGETFIDVNGNGIYDEGIDTPLDTAYVKLGQLLGIDEYPGAKNSKLSSANYYINGYPDLGDPNLKEEARNYMLGLTRIGNLINPCIWNLGQVRGGVDCSQVNPLFWYSGDPVLDYGWICTDPRDLRMLQNVGPFTLEKGKEYEIFVAYNIDQGIDALSSITDAKNIASMAGVLYDSNFDTTSVVSVEEIQSGNIPEEYFLSQNYPNPFNPSTKIEFRIVDFGFVTLKVYDILGNEVATLVNEEKAPGSYEVEFSAKGGSASGGNAYNLPSGVYIYSLRAGSFSQTKKMILMK